MMIQFTDAHMRHKAPQFKQHMKYVYNIHH